MLRIVKGMIHIMKKVAILQSNYIPWKGYFDMINMVDEFVLYDDMLYTKNDWRNRNIIKNFAGTQWLSIPVVTKGRIEREQRIRDTEVISSRWCKKHWKTIQYNYTRAACFDVYADRISELYKRCEDEKFLSRINYLFLTEICEILGISTKISWSSEYHLDKGKTEKVVSICKQANASEYISGPAAKDYINPVLFDGADIKLTYIDYSDYREYPQLHGEFVHAVSILDMLFNLGEQTSRYMKSFH